MATKAYYQHHQKTTDASLITDLQLRELGFSSESNYAIIKDNSSTSRYIPTTSSVLTASKAIFSDSDGLLTTNNLTGTGNVVMSASPTLTGIIGAASMTLSGTLVVTGTITASNGVNIDGLTASLPVSTDASKNLISSTVTGTGTTVVLSAEPTITGSFTLTPTSQPYLFTDRSDTLVIQGQTTNTSSGLELYTKDGDGNEGISLSLFAVGTPAAITNRERLLTNYSTSASAYQIVTEAGGTGTVRPLKLYTGANTTQLVLNIDGSVSLSGALSATSLTLTSDLNMADDTAINWGATTISQTDTAGVETLSIQMNTCESAFEILNYNSRNVFYIPDSIGGTDAILIGNETDSDNPLGMTFMDNTTITMGTTTIAQTEAADAEESLAITLVGSTSSFTIVAANSSNIFTIDNSDNSMAWGTDTNYSLFDSDGHLTMAGDARGTITEHFTFNYASVQAQGWPTLVNQGAFYGFSLPVYAADNEELSSCSCISSQWDGTTDPVIIIGGWLAAANTDKKFQLQISVEVVDVENNEVIPTTTNDYPVEITTGTWAQYTSFKAQVTIDASVITMVAGKTLTIRIRRIAASTAEITDEVVIEGAAITYTVNKIGAAI